MNEVTVSLKVIEGKSDEFLQTIQTLEEKLKQEEGFQKCNIHKDLSDETTFSLVEEWKTQDDLENHLKSDLFRVLIGALKVLSTESEVKYRLVSDRQGNKVFEVS